MKTKQIIGLVIAVVLFIVTGVASVLTHSLSGSLLKDAAQTALAGNTEFAPPAGEYIAVVDIVGTIQEQSSSAFSSSGEYQHSTNLDYIDALMDDSNNRGILLYVDSPGGTVYESQEMYDKLMEYKERTGRKIYAYMSHYGASGAYMISMAADRIYVNQNTTTGSIGVIMSGYDMSGLYEKLGIENINITSGENKATTFTEEQIEIYQSQVDEYFDQFVNIVAQGRDLSEQQVRKLADGRTYTARQAVKNGLVDEIAAYEDAVQSISQELGTDTYYELKGESGLFASLLARLETVMPKSDSQVLKETAEELESGVFMYYAKLS